MTRWVLFFLLLFTHRHFVIGQEYEGLRTKAAIKTVVAKKLTLAEGKKRAYKLIDKWAN